MNVVRKRSWVSAVAAWIRLGRPKFLLGGFALFGLGAQTAYFMGYGFDLELFLGGQLVVSSIQLMTHYSNDYFDLPADRANLYPTPWSGGSRVLVRGELPRWSALVTAVILALVAAVTACLLAWQQETGAWLTLLVFVSMLVLSWSYSSPPLSLHSRGWGEPAVALVVPFLTPLSGFVLQARTLRGLPVLLTLPLVLLILMMLMTLQMPDRKGDWAVGKKTWTVVFGVRKIASLCSGLVVGAFALGLSSILFGAPLTVAIGWSILLPLGMLQLLNFARRDYENPRAFGRLTFTAVALFFLAVVSDLSAMIVASHLAPNALLHSDPAFENQVSQELRE